MGIYCADSVAEGNSRLMYSCVTVPGSGRELSDWVVECNYWGSSRVIGNTTEFKAYLIDCQMLFFIFI